jgi:acyl-CoA thioesterase
MFAHCLPAAGAGRGALALPRAAAPALQRRCLAITTSATAPLLPIAYLHSGPGLPPELYQTAPDAFLADTHTLWTPPGARGVYGGHVVATAMLAAERSLPQGAPRFPMNSLHGYFLRPGNSALPTTYSVERLRDGRSFVTRAVTARQGGEAIFSLQCSFHALEADTSKGALGHQLRMPQVPSPEELTATAAAAAAAGGGGGAARQLPPLPLRVLPCFPGRRAPQWPARQLAWMAMAPLPPPSPATAHLHRAALAFAADWGIGVTSLLPYNLQWNSPQLAIAASLDHAMHFHDALSGEGARAAEPGGAGSAAATAAAAAAAAAARPIERHADAPRVPLPGAAPPQRADAFVLFEMESSVLRSGRGMNSCRLWSQDGTLLCSATQESLLRAR